MKRYEQISAFILCGGASSRMGQPKGLLDFGGEPLLIRIARLVEPLVSAIMAVGTHSQYADLVLLVIEDAELEGSQERHVKAGPLARIATSLMASRIELNLIVGCNLPYF